MQCPHVRRGNVTKTFDIEEERLLTLVIHCSRCEKNFEVNLLQSLLYQSHGILATTCPLCHAIIDADDPNSPVGISAEDKSIEIAATSPETFAKLKSLFPDSKLLEKVKKITDNENCAVCLIDSGDELIKLIKEIRQIFGGDLHALKDLVESCPSLLGVRPSIEAYVIKRKLEMLGATVEIFGNEPISGT
jgi:ribosomal protein L7/L12